MWQQGLLAPGALRHKKKSFLVIIVIIFHLVKWLYCPSRLKGHILCSSSQELMKSYDTAKYKLLFLVVWGSGWAVEVGKGLLDCHFGKCIWQLSRVQKWSQIRHAELSPRSEKRELAQESKKSWGSTQDPVPKAEVGVSSPKVKWRWGARNKRSKESSQSEPKSQMESDLKGSIR